MLVEQLGFGLFLFWGFFFLLLSGSKSYAQNTFKVPTWSGEWIHLLEVRAKNRTHFYHHILKEHVAFLSKDSFPKADHRKNGQNGGAI